MGSRTRRHSPSPRNALFLAVSLLVPGCGTSTVTDGGVPDAPPRDASEMDSPPPTDGGAPDVPPDAAEPPEDAPVDAPPDASADVGSDAGLSPLELFATIGDSFVRIDTATGDATVVGPTGVGPVAKLTYDASADVLYGVIDYLTTAPRLVTVDPCTGTATVRVTLSLTGGPLYLVGALEYDPLTDTLFATISRDGPYPPDGLEEHLARVDPETGTLTPVGDLLEEGTLLDGDALMFSPTLRLLMDTDPHPPLGPIHTVWRLDLTSGAGSGRVTAPGSVDTLETHGSVLYGWSSAGALARHLVTVDPATGELTDVGITHSASELGGAALWTLVEARAHCD